MKTDKTGIKIKITSYVVKLCIVLVFFILVAITLIAEAFISRRSTLLQETEARELSSNIDSVYREQFAYLRAVADTATQFDKNLPEDRELLQKALSDGLSKNVVVSNYYIGYPDGDYIIGTGWNSDEYDPTKRDWYLDAVAAGDIYVSPVYADYFNQKSCITISTPIYDGAKELYAVLAADIYTDDIVSLCEKADKTALGYMILVDSDGNILYHKKAELNPMLDSDGTILLRSYKDAGLKDSLIKSEGDISVQYSLGGVYRAVVNESSGMIVISAMDFLDYFRPVISVILVVILVLIFLYFYTRNSLQKKLSPMFAPLDELNVVAEFMSMGFLSYESQYHEEDEIGTLCTSVEQSNGAILQYINEITEVMDAMASGDFTKKIETEYEGDFVPLKVSVNATGKAMRLRLAELQSLVQELNQEVSDLHEGKATVSKEKMEAQFHACYDILSQFKIDRIDGSED